MAEKGIYLTPTLSCYGIMARAPFQNFMPPSGLVKNKQVMGKGLEALQVRFFSVRTGRTGLRGHRSPRPQV